jgi:hypothetical protein
MVVSRSGVRLDWGGGGGGGSGMYLSRVARTARRDVGDLVDSRSRMNRPTMDDGVWVFVRW